MPLGHRATTGRALNVLFALLVSTATVEADGPRDNIPTQVRRIPKLGVELGDDQKSGLRERLDELAAKLSALRASESSPARLLLPDVEIFYLAASYALEHQEFFRASEVESAHELITAGLERARQLLSGRAPWTTQTGLVVRGYRSKIDESVQPYGLVVPPSCNPPGAHRHRLDIWFHGRGETLSEVNFLTQRRKQIGRYAPKDTIVLHPYGRYSNAFKFAGEIDVLEALEDVQSRYPIDPDRISVRGFSMGGAACWQFAVHYADRWFAANPGAGFSETPEFLKFFQKETLAPTWYERKLWQLYDCNGWAANLHNLPTIAYSGELDIQKQAADIMETALEREGIDLVHIIGAGTRHNIDEASKRVIESRLDAIAGRGRARTPRRVRFVTYTLRYNRMHWVRVHALGEHWVKATVEARAVPEESRVSVSTTNIRDLELVFEPGSNPFEVDRPVTVEIDGQPIEGSKPRSDASWSFRVSRVDDSWRPGALPAKPGRKRHGLQGPIDDAFMDSFLFVRPTGLGANAAVAKWANAEMERAGIHWRRHFRGRARIKDDADVTSEDIASSHLVLWGEPSSNRILAKMARGLPISWSTEQIQIGEVSHSSENHALVMICPNPLNPARYVVLNSGFTYREFAYLNNARQVPKLPDWAVVDVRTPPDSLWPGKIVDADFFDESWQLRQRAAER